MGIQSYNDRKGIMVTEEQMKDREKFVEVLEVRKDELDSRFMMIEDYFTCSEIERKLEVINNLIDAFTN